jgi:hypothetical protein
MTHSYLSESSTCDFVVKFRVLDFSFNIVAGTPVCGGVIGLFLKWKDFVNLCVESVLVMVQLASIFFTTPNVQISFRILS